MPQRNLDRWSKKLVPCHFENFGSLEVEVGCLLDTMSLLHSLGPSMKSQAPYHHKASKLKSNPTLFPEAFNKTFLWVNCCFNYTRLKTSMEPLVKHTGLWLLFLRETEHFLQPHIL